MTEDGILTKPRVLIVIDTIVLGGPGKGIVQFLQEGGADLCHPIVTGFWRGPDRTWQFREAVEAAGIRFEVLPQSHAFDFRVIKLLNNLIRDYEINIIQSHGYKAHVACFFARAKIRVPWVAFVHGWTNENLKVRVYNLIDKLMVRFADRIVPVSEDLRRKLFLSKRCERRVRVIANAVRSPPDDTEKAADIRKIYGVGESEFLIGVIGRLSPEKGHADFIKAMKLLVGDCPDINAMFVGDGQEKQAIERAIKENSLQDNIILAGYQVDLSGFYKGFDLVVMPSHTEGLPNVALEAMSYAKPVVATRTGGIPEVVEDGVTGYLVPLHNPAALADAVVKLMKDRSLLERLGNTGKEVVMRKHNVHGRIRKIVEVYEETGV